MLQPPGKLGSSSSSAPSRALSFASPGSRNQRGALSTGVGSRLEGRTPSASQGREQPLPLGGSCFPVRGTLCPCLPPHAESKLLPGQPTKKPNQPKLSRDKSKIRMEKNFATHISSFLGTHAKAPLLCIGQAQPNSSLPGKKLSQGQPHAFINRRKRKQMKIALKNCFFLIRQRFRRRTRQRCGFLPGNEDVPCSKRCSCKSRARNSTHFCCRVCCGGERGLCHSYTFPEAWTLVKKTVYLESTGHLQEALVCPSFC